MLLTLSVDNFRSFGETAVLDMQRRSFRTQHPREGETWQANTLRRAAIFGPNAAGKSNILRALGQVRNAVGGSLTSESFVKALRDPHKLRLDASSSFEVEYVSEDIRYRWGLEVNNRGVASEYLEANAHSRWYVVFERTDNDVVFGSSSGIELAAKQNIQQFMTPWALALSAWATLRDQGKHRSAMLWWQRLLPFIDTSVSAHQDGRHQWLMDLAEKDPHWLDALRTAVSVADVGIDQVEIKQEAPDEVKSFVLRLTEDGASVDPVPVDRSQFDQVIRYLEYKHSGADDDSFSLNEADESRGTQVWIDLAGPAIVALATGGVMVVDEIDGSLHPMLVRELVSYFGSEKLNPLGAQLLFSTHDSTLLGKYPDEGLERAEVWLVEKQDSYSELIALDEFPVKANHNIEKRYLQGRYGALPLLDQAGLRNQIETIRESYLQAVPQKNGKVHV